MELAFEVDNIKCGGCDALLRLGYPERGSASGMSAVGAKAKSFVSCAIGRLSD